MRYMQPNSPTRVNLQDVVSLPQLTEQYAYRHHPRFACLPLLFLLLWWIRSCS